MKMFDTPHALSDYLDKNFDCDCGKTHYAPLKAFRMGKNVLETLPQYITQLGFHSVYLISDGITYGIAGERCMQILEQAGIKAKIQKLTHISFDEATVGELLVHMPADCDLVIAVGTGAINDMTRFFSYRIGRPFFTVATAAPMDGFASSISALNVNNMKTTFEAQTPTVILGDIEILKNAPYPMIAAGMSDLLGKFVSLCDWKIARIVNGEHYCDKIVALVENCIGNVLIMADGARRRDPKVLGDIMEGLVLTGVAMSLYGNSRPASGCEHHMSHYWEMIFEQRHQRPVPHGAQVGVGTVLMLKLAEALKEMPIGFDAARQAAARYDAGEWEKRITAAYGSAAPGIIALEHKAGKNETQARLARIRTMEAHWSEIMLLLNELPSSRRVINLLQSMDSPYLPEQIGVDNALLKNTFLYCKEVRDRYTLLQLLWDLDLLDVLSEHVIASLHK